ncbi:MAG: GntR family transcriptional regulator [Anaerolineae bacterium]|nr:GntR family transcriptional regulator [Anaerolineae bacterium]
MVSFTKVEGISRYAQIREALRQEINAKRLLPGQKLPSEDELAAQFGVSRMTVRQGISDLLDEGLLYRKHGVGTFIAQPQIARDHSRLSNFFESSLANHVEAAMRVLVSEILPAKLKIGKALALEEGDLVIHIKTLRSANGIPVTVHDAYVPYKLFPRLLKEDLVSHHIWDYMGQYGYPVKRAVQRLEAREADEKLSKLLGIEAGAPTLYKERTVYAEDGTPVEFTYCYNRGDRYSLTVTLSR